MVGSMVAWFYSSNLYTTTTIAQSASKTWVEGAKPIED